MTSVRQMEAMHEIAGANSYVSYIEIWSVKDEPSLRRLLPVDEIGKLCTSFTIAPLARGNYPYRSMLVITNDGHDAEPEDQAALRLINKVQIGKHKIEEIRIATDVPLDAIPEGYTFDVVPVDEDIEVRMSLVRKKI